MRFGIVRFPGSCDEVDAMLAAQRVGEAVILWHQDTDLQGVDAVIVPGGFSYGDYLRVGAIARFAPIMGEVERFARHGGLIFRATPGGTCWSELKFDQPDKDKCKRLQA